MSGGMDSTLSTVWAKGKYKKVIALFFSWGQKAEKDEWAAVQRICEKLDIKKVKKIDAPISRWDQSSLTKGTPNKINNEDFMVPERNLVFISLAASYARAKGGGSLVVGFNQDDGGYDTSQEFVNQINEFFNQGTEDLKCETGYISGTFIKLEAPLIKKTKPLIREQLKSSGLFSLTYSCYAAGGFCLECKACQKRIEL